VRVADLRAALGLKQADLALVLGVHSMTVSKWERGELVPTPYQQALLEAFGRAIQRDPGLRTDLLHTVLSEGSVKALYTLLRGAYE
jgi:putative transcriptional regulator